MIRNMYKTGFTQPKQKLESSMLLRSQTQSKRRS